MPGRTAPVYGKKNKVCRLYPGRGILISSSFYAVWNLVMVKGVKNVVFIRVSSHFLAYEKPKCNTIMIDAVENAILL